METGHPSTRVVETGLKSHLMHLFLFLVAGEEWELLAKDLLLVQHLLIVDILHQVRVVNAVCTQELGVRHLERLTNRLCYQLSLQHVKNKVIPRLVKWKGTEICIVPHRKTLTSGALRYGSHSFTLQTHHACLYLVSVHQTAPPLTSNSSHLIAAYYLVVGPLTTHSTRRGRSSRVSIVLSRCQRAYTPALQLAALNSVGCRPHLSSVICRLLP